MGEDYTENVTINPPQEVLDRCEFFHDIPDNFLKAYTSLWNNVKNAREFLFGVSATVSQDGVVTDEEADYVAAVADAIGAYGWTQVEASGSTSRY